MTEQSPRTPLPPIDEETVDRIERAVFDEIGAERAPASATSRRPVRRRVWTGIGVAAAFALGVMLTPTILSVTAPQVSTADSSSEALRGAAMPEVGPSGTQFQLGQGESAADSSIDSAAGGSASAGREIITTSSLSLQVADIDAASAAIAKIATDHGGYVENSTIGGDPGPVPYQGDVMSMPAAASGWIGIRVPTQDLDATMDALRATGTVTGSSISRQDVTTYATDLEARISAYETSVERLKALMAEAGSVGDLLAAETALSDRQAQLDSARQEQKNLREQVDLTAVQVQLSTKPAVTTADPAGFSDGLRAGWNGLVASLNALVITAGFVIPWLIPAAVVVLLVWLIRRRRRRPSPKEDSE
ncbi:MAG: DUF4349 domain-containing protein [Microbacterium sp.]